MEIRGERQCKACGARWSYYETGEIACPDCGSVRSVGLDERTEHTASPVTLDLSPVREKVDRESLSRVGDAAADRARKYVASAGFVHAGELQPLSEMYLAAAELRRVGTTLSRRLRVDENEERYFLALLHGADQGERPAPEEVPETLHPERGLAVAAGVDAYLTDLRRVLDEREQDREKEREVDRLLSAITTRRKRVEALDGDVDPTESERLVRAVRDLSTYLREDDETALVRAGERLTSPS